MSTTTIRLKQKPLILSNWEVRAVLDGRKTQKRVVVKGSTDCLLSGYAKDSNCAYWKKPDGSLDWNQCKFGGIGDKLWVRETLRCDERGLFYAADDTIIEKSRIPNELKRVGEFCDPFHMPQWASRISLEITNISVERLQDIGAAGAKAEGAEPFLGSDATAWRAGFQIKWDEANAKRGHSWESNPWVWAIEFRRVT